MIETPTNRYGRRTITIKGLMRGTPLPNAKAIMQEHGVVWDLHQRPNNAEPVEITTKKTFIAGKELLTSFTTAEKKWIMELAEENGLDIGIVEETSTISPTFPSIEVNLLTPCSFESSANPEIGEWVAEENISGKGCTATVNIKATGWNKSVQIIIESPYPTHVNSDVANNYATSKIKLIRSALKAAGYVESNLEIDCEVIMGAEREAKCDPEFMRSMLEEEEE